MKAVCFIAIMLFVLFTVGSVSAAELDFSNTPGATDAVSVYASYSGNQLTVWAEPKSASVTSVRIDEIGFNRPTSDVDNVLDNLGTILGT